VVDVAAGGAHSACVTAAGDLYTWGKGRYGRLGHSDSEDQLKPKLVEALQGHRVVDVACGSGDAQTLCLTDDDTVWSWGDGDYGKLGRGGSDGCKVPMKVFVSAQWEKNTFPNDPGMGTFQVFLELLEPPGPSQEHRGLLPPPPLCAFQEYFTSSYLLCRKYNG